MESILGEKGVCVCVRETGEGEEAEKRNLAQIFTPCEKEKQLPKELGQKRKQEAHQPGSGPQNGKGTWGSIGVATGELAVAQFPRSEVKDRSLRVHTEN